MKFAPEGRKTVKPASEFTARTKHCFKCNGEIVEGELVIYRAFTLKVAHERCGFEKHEATYA